MWLVLSLTAFLLFALLGLSIALIVRVCLQALMTDVHDVFSPTPGSDSRQSPRE